ncbi:MAG: class I adenylate-forming enzyme family protein [Polyangiales bacterium]
MAGSVAASPSTSGVLAKVRDAAQRAETAAALALNSGLLWSFRAKGAAAAVRLLAQGKSGPSTIYRIHGANSPDKVGLVWAPAKGDVRRWTYGEMDSRCDRLAEGLRRRGLAGQSVLVMMKNRPEYLILGTGASRAGAAVVTISWRSTAAELAYLANHCGAKAIVFDAAVAATVEKARSELTKIPKDNFFVVGEADGFAPFEDLLEKHAEARDAAEEGAVVVYTSGTTGKPKGAVRKFNKELLPSIFRFLRETPFRADDVHLAACPLYHTTAFGFIAMSQILGATIVLMDEYDPKRYLENVEKHQVTTTVLVPTMLHRLLSLGDQEIQKHDTRSLKALFCTSAPLPGPDSNKAMELFGDIVWNLYGSTETGIVTLARPEDLKHSPGTIGRAVAGNEIRLLDDQGNDVPEGEVGELFTKNAMLVAGYHADEGATKSSMKDGHFSVGDLARRDARGCYHLEGRKRDMIISGGVNVYPAEVESVLEKHPAVDEVAVVGLPDPEWGERVTAVVVAKNAGANLEAELKAWCKEQLAGPKVPRAFVILPPGEHLPRNPTGKVLKRDLRAKLAPQSTAESATPESGAAR